MADHPLLSVIVPVYNCEAYLDECLRSVLDQADDSIELVAVDDGSEDGTAALLAAYRQDPRVQICLRPHSGASDTRNAGLSLARGEYVTFLDCDDCLREEFLPKARELLDGNSDLIVFGIERVHLTGNSEFWTVQDHIYPTASDFADEYIRYRHLLLYSNCNKFYRRSLIETLSLQFEPGISFGEDRLFNYRYLPGCGQITTSSLIMLRYLERSVQSQSTQHVPFFFRRVMELHRAKMDCILSLSKGTTGEERRSFAGYDLSREVANTVERFSRHPEERKENLPDINRLVFGDPVPPDPDTEVLIVLGSRNCEYKAKRACEIAQENPGLLLIVSGGNPHGDMELSEAEFMADYLTRHGVEPSRIYLEKRAKFTRQNLELSAGILQVLESFRGRPFRSIGIVAGGFHINRTKALAESLSVFGDRRISFFPAYGPNTAPDTWVDNEVGREIILGELQKFPGPAGAFCTEGL